MIEFLNALFQPDDLILVRPIEVWKGKERKESRVDYRGITYCTPAQLDEQYFDLLQRSEEQRTNLFFGVCPRYDLGQFDKSWQIRIVRHLWADMDDISTLKEADEACALAGLPPASVVVQSGNGIHLYWLLLEPLRITDADDPVPVEIEWLLPAIPGGKKRRNEYIMNNGEKLPLSSRQNVPQLSPQATKIQFTLQGIAAALGADHTTDLARVLRLPGTMNRKNQRHGDTPKPCTLLRCDPSTRYTFEQFTHLTEAAPTKQRQDKIKAYHMPGSRRLSRHSKTAQEKINNLAYECETVSTGQRSEADFSFCCFAIRRGVDKEDCWELVQTKGKFAERGRDYFETTWDKAYDIVQEERFDHYEKVREESCEAAEDDPGLIRTVADHICDTNHFAVDRGNLLYRYVAGRYIPTAEQYVRRQVKHTCIDTGNSRKWRSGLADEVIKYIQADAPELWNRPPEDVINVQNGLLDLATCELQDHSPEFLSPVQLAVTYDPDATCPAIDQFISEVFPQDAHRLAIEIPANLMTPDTSIQKAVLLLGSGGNGKSVYLRLISALLGKSVNVSNLPLHQLEHHRFALSSLYGKLANICSDLPGEHLRSTNVFKSITGGDAMVCERKFRDAFEFTPFARLVFSANHPPRSLDSSQAFFDRWVVVPMEAQIRGTRKEIPQSELDRRLHNPSELSGWLNQLISAQATLRKNRRFSIPVSAREAALEFQATTDPMTAWFTQYTVDDPKSATNCEDMLFELNLYREKKNLPPLTQASLTAAIKKHRPRVACVRNRIDKERKRQYVGIAMTHCSKYNI